MHLQWTGQLVTGHDALDVDLRDITISSVGGHTFLYTSTGVNGGLTAYELTETGGNLTCCMHLRKEFYILFFIRKFNHFFKGQPQFF